ncbi:MAG: flagellar protein FliT [Sterolibacterium sp.]|jgi:flagellar protein FliT|nr:flagellar protein FliT [Sterolibacterium sp.]
MNTQFADDRLPLYQAMSELTGQMAAAAQANDWDALVTLEEQLAPVRERLLHSPTAALHAQALTAENAEAMLALIQTIQSHHETISTCVQPHLDDLRQLMNDTASRRRIDAAYGAENPMDPMGSGSMGSGL